MSLEVFDKIISKWRKKHIFEHKWRKKSKKTNSFPTLPSLFQSFALSTYSCGPKGHPRISQANSPVERRLLSSVHHHVTQVSNKWMLKICLVTYTCRKWLRKPRQTSGVFAKHRTTSMMTTAKWISLCFPEGMRCFSIISDAFRNLPIYRIVYQNPLGLEYINVIFLV